MLIAEPWPHIVIDNYYEEIMFNNMCDEITQFVKELKARGSLKDKKTTIKYTDSDLPLTYACIKSRAISQLDLSMFPKVRDHKDLGMYTEVNICRDDMRYPIHDENPKKVLSAVTYLLPETSRGTLLYDQYKNFVKEVEWKPNRTLIFAPIDGVTWHTYESIPGSYRITVNMFLVR